MGTATSSPWCFPLATKPRIRLFGGAGMECQFGRVVKAVDSKSTGVSPAQVQILQLTLFHHHHHRSFAGRSGTESKPRTMCTSAAAAGDALRLLFGSSKSDAPLVSSPSFGPRRGGGGGGTRLLNCARWTTTTRPLVLEPLRAATRLPTTAAERSTLKERLKNGEQLYGAFSVSFSPVVAEILGWSGYDFVVVDLEHGPGDTMAAVSILQALSSTGTPAIIRIPANDPVWAKKALDLGPAGIMFPMINDANAAKEAVRSCRYPPAGIRGAAHPIVRAARYGLDLSYLSRCEDDLLIMCQIESEQAVDNIVDIAAVDGVDCIQMGPLDLRSDMGLLRDPDDKRTTMLLREVEKTLESSGVYLAGFATSDDSPSKLLQLGYHMVSGAIDVALLRDSALADVRKARGQ